MNGWLRNPGIMTVIPGCSVISVYVGAENYEDFPLPFF